MRLPRWRPALSGAIVAASTVAACETVPYTGRSQLQFMSPQQESQLGVQAYQQTLAKARLSSDAAASGMVARVGSRIAAVTGHPEYQWEYRLIQDDKQANAFALPGGKVAVYTGILPITRDESGLAAVLGHEIGHVVARHGGERVSQQTLVPADARQCRARDDDGGSLLGQSCHRPGRSFPPGCGGDRRSSPPMEPGAGVGGRPHRTHPDGQGRLRSSRRAGPLASHGCRLAGVRTAARVPLHPSFGAHPNPADRGLDTGGHAVLPPALSPGSSHMR